MMDLCGPFESQPVLAIALSGGIDSMVLMLLSDAWAKERGGRIVCLTVDHGLRLESQQESLLVAQECAKHAIDHHILHWKPGSLSSAIQAQARDSRYALLTDWCRENHVLHLLTAHHRDDQSETLFFRLARSSGMDGLASMPAISLRNGIRHLRPLLQVSKNDLRATLDHHGQSWMEDATNQKDDYTRNRIRKMLQHQQDADALSQRASDVALQFGHIRSSLEQLTAQHMAAVIQLYPAGYAMLDYAGFRALPKELALRLLSGLVVTLNGESHPPRQEKLERFYAALLEPDLFTRRALAGLLFTKTKQGLCVYREAKATAHPITLSCAEYALWDKRFAVVWHSNVEEKQLFTIRSLGHDGIKQLSGACFPPPTSKAILSMFPSFWSLEKLVAVPHIAYTNPSAIHLRFEAVLSPPKPLAGAAFYAMNKQTSV